MTALKAEGVKVALLRAPTGSSSTWRSSDLCRKKEKVKRFWNKLQAVSVWRGQGRKPRVIKYSCVLCFFKHVLGTCAANRQLVCTRVTREQMCAENSDHKMAGLTTGAVWRVIFYSVDLRDCWGRKMGPVL